MSPFWWLSNIRYLLYFLREFSGPVIAIYAAYFLIRWYLDPSLLFLKNTGFQVLSWIVLAFSILHTITWFIVTGKLTRWFVSVLLIIVWVFISIYLLFPYFYVIPPVVPLL